MAKRLTKILLLTTIVSSQGLQDINTQKFPDDFLFGASSSAYQTEGAWNEDGKGESVWDHFAHSHPEKILDRSNGDVACDSYHKYKEDVVLLKNLGVDFYRFSLAWSRILPLGLPNKINPAGIKYYNDLIDELVANDITPMVTMFHWDLPLWLQRLGGFSNPAIVEWFEAYARIVFENFGDRVKIWTTFNEPRLICQFGYGEGVMAPGVALSGIGDYICGHHLVKAHARTYHLYNDVYKPKQHGRIGLIIDCQWYEPASNSTKDHEAAERKLQFDCGIYGHPVFSEDGGYPQVVSEFIAQRSKEEGFSRSRLPKFTSEEIAYIRGTFDYVGVNHYTTYLAANKKADPIGDPSREKDTRAAISQDPSWPASSLQEFRIAPWGFRKVLKWIKDNYDNPEIYVGENGYADVVQLHDDKRIDYHKLYLSSLLDSIYEDGVRVKAYSAWSLLDYYEWNSGYTFGFGLHYVNFSDPSRPRIPRDSAAAYSKIIKNRRLVPTF